MKGTREWTASANVREERVVDAFSIFFAQSTSTADLLTLNAPLRYIRHEAQDSYLVYNDGVNTDHEGFDPVRPVGSGQTLRIK
jgi:hypothetical protein